MNRATPPLRYCLHSGYVYSPHDRQRHWIGVVELARLYALPAGSWFRWDHGYEDNRAWVHLYPCPNGDYAATLAALEHTQQRP